MKSNLKYKWLIEKMSRKIIFTLFSLVWGFVHEIKIKKLNILLRKSDHEREVQVVFKL
jgi:hypothetical protein